MRGRLAVAQDYISNGSRYYYEPTDKSDTNNSTLYWKQWLFDSQEKTTGH